MKHSTLFYICEDGHKTAQAFRQTEDEVDTLECYTCGKPAVWNGERWEINSAC